MERHRYHPYKPYFIGSVVLLLAIGGYSTYEVLAQRAEIDFLKQERNYFLQQNASSTNAYNAARTVIASLEAERERLQEELEDLADDYRDERNRNEEFEDQIRGLAGTLGNLEKLKSIDEELLTKYSKASFLNENYIPSKLGQIDERYVHPSKTDEYFHAEAMEHLEDLLDAARRAGHDMLIISAYRSFDEQNQMKAQYKQVYGEGANAFSADQGFSEHQLGTTIDLTTEDIGTDFERFGETEAYEWMLKNAHRYGFILSYPEGNEFYIYEPWHWRFVSRELARDLNRRNTTFYELEQREINEYLLEFFD